MRLLPNLSLSVAVVAAAALMTFAGTWPASAAEEKRNVTGFKAVTLAGSGHLDITVGKDFSVVLESDDETLKRTVSEIRQGDTLFIGPERDKSWFAWGNKQRTKLNVRVTMPELRGAVLAGSGEINVDNAAGEELALSVNGSGDINAKGKVNRVKATVNGSGDMHLRDLAAEEVSIVVNGSGDAEVAEPKSLKVVVNGSGDVTHGGSPQVSSVVHGSGHVKQR